MLADHDADVFDRVVLVDFEITIGAQLQIEGAMLREQLEHVIEEANAGLDFVASAAFNAELAGNTLSSLVLRSILAVRGKNGLQRIDVVDYGYRALFAQKLD